MGAAPPVLDQDQAAAPDDGAEVAPEFQAPPEATPPAPDVPRARPRESKASKPGKTDWRAKYREGAADGERETMCVQIAAMWIGVLHKANAATVAAGGTPWIPSDLLAESTDQGLKLGPLGKSLVLATDKLVPADFTIGPEVVAGAVSGAIVIQSWWTSRKAKAKAPPQRDPYHAAPVEPPPAPPADSAAAPVAASDGGGRAPINGTGRPRPDAPRLTDGAVF